MSRLSIKMLIPGITSFLSLTKENYLLAVVSVLVLLLLIATEKECRGRENFWIYVLCGVSTISVNIEGAYRVACLISYLGIYGKFYLGLIFVLILALLFNLEEMILGTVGRFIWRRQQKVNINNV